MLRLGRCYPGKKTWGPAHMKWLRSQKLEHREQRMALEELLEGVRQEGERVERLEQAIGEGASKTRDAQSDAHRGRSHARPPNCRVGRWRVADFE
jgi:hypothetical protein